MIPNLKLPLPVCPQILRPVSAGWTDRAVSLPGKLSCKTVLFL
jgi:hypothetical protein